MLGMAFIARDVLMRPLQRVGRYGVIELEFLERDVQPMASVAVLGELPLVDVFMAGRAAGALDEIGRRRLS
jgi:hypothetical protein